MTVLCLGTLALVAFFVAPTIAVNTPPSAAAAGLVRSVPADQLAEKANETLGLVASSVVTLDLAGPRAAGLTTVVPIFGEQFTLDLWPHSVRSQNYQVLVQGDDGSYTEIEPQPVNTMRGVVLEIEGSSVSASLTDEGLCAKIVFDDEEQYWIEPIASRIVGAAPGQHVVYHVDDVIPSGGTCAADVLDHPVPDVGDDIGDRDSCGSGGVVCIAELAIDADYRYYQDWGYSTSAVENRVNDVINMVNSQYEDDVVITHVITAIIIRTSSGADPYTTNDPEDLLNQFRSHWQSNHGSIDRDMASLFTGRNMSGSVIGIAWLNAVCTNYGYSVVESDCCGSLSCAADLSAHEMGHNWSADHCSCSSYTMNAYLTCSNQFHPTYTQPEIESYRNSHQYCMDAGTYCDHPNFLTQPDPSQLVCGGSTVYLSVSVDTAAPAYQWQMGGVDLVNDGVHIFGATTSTLTIVDIVEADHQSTEYRCEVTDTSDDCVKYSDEAEISVEDIVFSPQPQNLTVNEGEYAELSVGSDAGLPTYQWRKDGSPLSNDGRIHGTTTLELWIYPAQVSDAGQYDCVVTSTIGLLCSETSDEATLTVTAAEGCPEPGTTGNYCLTDIYPNNGDGSWNYADDGDCVIDMSDLGELLPNYGVTSGMTREDGDVYPVGAGDGAVDMSDLGEMLAQYGDDCN